MWACVRLHDPIDFEELMHWCWYGEYWSEADSIEIQQRSRKCCWANGGSGGDSLIHRTGERSPWVGLLPGLSFICTKSITQISIEQWTVNIMINFVSNIMYSSNTKLHTLCISNLVYKWLKLLEVSHHLHLLLPAEFALHKKIAKP